MIIVAAIVTYNGGEAFRDCLCALEGQRIIKADTIKIYDLGSTDNTLEIAHSFRTQVTQLAPDNPLRFNRLWAFKQVIADNQNTDILFFLDQHSIIDASAISEIFRLFLKYEDVATVYGRKVADPDDSLFTRYSTSYFFPITHKDYPTWYLMRIYSCFNLVAYRIKYLLEPGVIPERNFKAFGDLYIAARLVQHGYKNLYNPFALYKLNTPVRLKYVYIYAKYLLMFLEENPWLTKSWNIRTSEIEYFCEELKQYIKANSSIPLLSLQADIAYIMASCAKWRTKRAKLRIKEMLAYPESNE